MSSVASMSTMARGAVPKVLVGGRGACAALNKSRPHSQHRQHSLRVLAFQPAQQQPGNSSQPQRTQQQAQQQQTKQPPSGQKQQSQSNGSEGRQLVFGSEQQQTFDVILRFKGDDRQLFAHSPVLRIASKTFESALAMEQEIGGEAPPAEEMPPAALAAAQHFSLDVTSKRIEEGGRIRIVHTLQVPQDQTLTPEKLDTFLRLVHSMFAARRSERPADVISWDNVRALLETSEHLGADAVTEACEEWLFHPPPSAAAPPWEGSDEDLLHWLVLADRTQMKRLTHKLVDELTMTSRIQRILFGPQWDFSTHSVSKDQYGRVSATSPNSPDSERKKPIKVVDTKFEETLRHLRPETISEIIVRRERCGRSAFRQLCSQLAPDEEHVYSKYSGGC